VTELPRTPLPRIPMNNGISWYPCSLGSCRKGDTYCRCSWLDSLQERKWPGSARYVIVQRSYVVRRKGAREDELFPKEHPIGHRRLRGVEAAAQAATELSRETGSEVHIVYTLPTSAQLIGPHSYSAEVREPLIGGAERDAETFLKEQAEKIGAEGGKVAETHLRNGDPDKEIIRTAEALDVGLIVIGSRGLGAISRALMGSVSDSVVRHAHCPVFVVRGGRAADEHPGDKPWRGDHAKGLHIGELPRTP
jgi:nucleotide-binding universal stress UspA family protein